jgi:hypothetical protein
VDDSRLRADSKLDEALEETFPASDPPANTVETGIRTGETPPPPIAPVSGNRPHDPSGGASVPRVRSSRPT